SVFVHNNGDIDIVFNYMTAKKTIKIDEFGSAFKLRGSPICLLPNLYLVGDCFGFMIHPGKFIFVGNKRG
ncbi:MAG TPA: hypothetical protein DCR94_06170, partial [Firmicutes bacterium]|nr:hypothetical protein [Bacillota bacterium]